MKKKVLIIGNSAKEYALAKILSETCEVFVAPGNDGIKEFATCLDIRETSSQEILEFVMENDIDMTIPLSVTTLHTNIVKLFNKNNLQIFAPAETCSKTLFDKFSAKKLMYKLGIPTPKFGIFEKQNIAIDYLKNIKGPFVLKNNAPSSAVVFASQQASRIIMDSMFAEKNSKVLIENYIYGTPFCFYAITDGYNALPISSSRLYRYSLEGDGGQLTSGMGAFSPNYKLSFANEAFLMNNVIYPTLDYLENNNSAYIGIMGINGILCDDGNMQILGYEPFMQNSDCAGILKLLDIDIYRLFESCVIGSFSDEINHIDQKDSVSVSVTLCCKNRTNTENVIQNIDTEDDNIMISFTNNVTKNKYLEFEANKGDVMVLTAIAGTYTNAAKNVYEEINNIKFNGMKYRRDICQSTINDICSQNFA